MNLELFRVINLKTDCRSRYGIVHALTHRQVIPSLSGQLLRDDAKCLVGDFVNLILSYRMHIWKSGIIFGLQCSASITTFYGIFKDMKEFPILS